MGITLAEFLVGKTVRSKVTGSTLTIVSAESPKNIVGRVVFPGDGAGSAQGLSQFIEHLVLLDIDMGSLRSGSAR